MKTTKLLICAVAFATAFAAVNAHGQNLSATLTGIAPGLNVNGTWNNGSFTHDYPAGVMNYTNVVNLSNSANLPDFSAFCVDPLQNAAYGETLVYQVQNPLSLANSETIARLVGGYLASSGSDQEAAAVQWAIWEVTTESLQSASLLDGNVRIVGPASQATALLANQYLANVNSYTPVTLTYLTNSTRQDVVTWNAVPEPGSVGLAALSGLLLLRRRRR